MSNENSGKDRRTTMGFSPELWEAIDAHQRQLREEHGDWVSSAGAIVSLVKAGARAKGLLPSDDATDAEAA